MTKNRGINGIKGSREIKETESSNFLLSHSVDDVVMNRKKIQVVALRSTILI